MPKKGRMFPGLTRQVIISEDTHRLLYEEAEYENKYIGELADEILRHVLIRRQQDSSDPSGHDVHSRCGQ